MAHNSQQGNINYPFLIKETQNQLTKKITKSMQLSLLAEMEVAKELEEQLRRTEMHKSPSMNK